MRLAGIEVDRYGPLRGFRHEPDGGLEVVYGPNESGKTLLLEGICRLLAPDCAALFPNMDRVERDPVGAVRVERDGETIACDGEQTLLDDWHLSARSLRNVFVIRDSDLRLADEHAFYDSVTEQIGDLHTGELDALEALLKERGRLTPTNLNLSTAADHHDAGTVRDEAATLGADIRDYVAEAREEGIEEQERRRIRVERERRRVIDELARQEVAETLSEHRTLTEHLETYRESVSALANASVIEDELEHLEALRRERRDAEREVERLEGDLDETRAERQSEREHLRTLESKLEGYRARENTVAEVRDQLAAVEDGVAPGQDRLSQFVGVMAVAGVLGGSVAAGLGARLVGVAALGVGLFAAGGWLLLYHRRAARERERGAVVDAARNAALPVEDFGDVRAAVESFEAERQRLDREREATAKSLEHLETAVDELTDEFEAARERVREADDELQAILDAGDHEDVEAYEATVAERERVAGERDRAAAVLESRLPPAVADATPGERIEAWEDALADLVADVDGEDADPDEYDPDRQADLEAALADLEAESDDLERALDDHGDELDRFTVELRELTTEPFVGADLTLPARSLDGLAEAADALEGLVATIERKAAVAREAVDVVAAVRESEEAKIAALFGDGGRAGEVLAEITDGRYVDVTYDADARTLRVHRQDGERLTPAQLSHGTAEQLYLAARVSLGEQLLGHEPGFFLLDDAFLPADRDRLERGFGVLSRLADAGWQVLYLTAKPEVGEEMAETFDLPVRELDGRV